MFAWGGGGGEREVDRKCLCLYLFLCVYLSDCVCLHVAVSERVLDLSRARKLQFIHVRKHPKCLIYFS